jgi:gamma-glutamylcyclotransferase (GGCT)/AIG2-like uncharacterized protein YtfP
MVVEGIKFFVYGTLKPGGNNYSYCDSRVVKVESAIAYGQLFDLPLGYPAMTPGEMLVRGYLLTFQDPEIFRILDRLEGYDPQQTGDENEYNRQQIAVFDSDGKSLGIAWTYVMSPSQVRDLGGSLILSGCWQNH